MAKLPRLLTELVFALLRQRYSKTVQIVRRSPDQDTTCVILGLAGDLDLASLPSVSSAVDQAIDDGAMSLVLNLSRVDSIDSAGIGLLTTATAQCTSADVDIALVATQTELRNIIVASNATLIVFGSLDDATTAIGIAT